MYFDMYIPPRRGSRALQSIKLIESYTSYCIHSNQVARQLGEQLPRHPAT